VSTPALEAAEAVGLSHRVIRHGPVGSLAEAARARGVAPADVVKTLVVRRGEDDFLFVLVPGDRRRDLAAAKEMGRVACPAIEGPDGVTVGVAISLMASLGVTGFARPPSAVG
jgi:prolyl-tRNA editing enzyme YbaK/EbsC (Cys-tRNA(Pro) deacylase)